MRQTELIRHRLLCRGVVQGVGFRPAVYRLATQHGLGGFVRNDIEGVTVEVEGAAARVAAFEAQFAAAMPPLAKLDQLRVETAEADGTHTFTVEASQLGQRGAALTPPDTALCTNCRREMQDPNDRRYRYPFTTCTDCGPRFSIVTALPYDRERTSMAPFPLCSACAAEYGDPGTRRFHAEPLCCPDCGPRLWLEVPDGSALVARDDAIAGARRQLADGHIVAIKGIGGFQLACRADDERAVHQLRLRKHRTGKPLALMAADLAAAHRLVRLQPADEALLTSARGPIVLAPRRSGAKVARSVAAGVDDLGVMLPTTPLHVELFTDARYDALVMTSGNRSDEPICIDNDDARLRLHGLADCLLLHDRDIVRRVDDSVVRTMPHALGPCVLRRSRGYAPDALRLPLAAPEPILALGGHLQTTACVAVGDHAHASQHVGDLDTESARAFLREVATGLEDFLECRARVLVADLHPDYASTWLAERLAHERGGRVLRVQHHLAHAAAVLAEHDAMPRDADEVAVALVLDGTGFGTDGTAWGCEWLRLDGGLRWSRLAHGQAFALVGGEKAVREPWRVAVAALCEQGLAVLLPELLPATIGIAPAHLQAAARLATRGGWPSATGAGRLFEAAGTLLANCPRNRYEGDAAMRLEALAASAPTAQPWPEVQLGPDDVLPQAALLAAAARRRLAGEPVAEVARGLHETFCSLATDLTMRVLPTGVRRIALAGGCFANRLLSAGIVDRLRAQGVTALRAVELPPGDGGLSFGQAVLGAASCAGDTEPRQIPIPTP